MEAHFTHNVRAGGCLLYVEAIVSCCEGVMVGSVFTFCFISLQIARELTISIANNRFGLFPMKFQETLDPPKRADETDLIPNEVGLASALCIPAKCRQCNYHMHDVSLRRPCCLYAMHTNKFLHVQWDKPGSQIVQMSTEFSELFTRELTQVRTLTRCFEFIGLASI